MTDLDEILLRLQNSNITYPEAKTAIQALLTHTLQTYKDETLEVLKEKWPKTEATDSNFAWSVKNDGYILGFNEALKQAWLVVEEELS